MFEQKKDGWCGPASLSYALMKQGVEASQEDIAKKTNTTVEDGVDPNPLIQFVNKLDLQTKVFNGEDAEKTLDEIAYFLYFGYSCLVDYLDQGEGHYVVVEDIEKDEIEIFDPSKGKGQRTLKRKEFIANWKDYTERGKVLKHWAFCFKKLT